MRAMGAVCNGCGASVRVEQIIRKDSVAYRIICPNCGKLEGGSRRLKVSR